MGSILATVTLNHKSGMAEDAVVNTFAVSTGGTDSIAANHGAITDAIANFYNGSHDGNVDSVGQWLGDGLSRAADGMSIKLYNITGHLDGSPHGSDMYEEKYTLDAPIEATTLPEEVSLALTLRGTNWEAQPVEIPDTSDPGTEVDRPRQRYTGRIYLGPWVKAAATTVNNRSRPTAAILEYPLDAAVATQAALNAVGYEWCVWSRKAGVLIPISHVQMDDAWDTQRRRGVDPTQRTTRAV